MIKSKMPVKISANLAVGSLNASLEEFKGLKHPLQHYNGLMEQIKPEIAERIIKLEEKLQEFRPGYGLLPRRASV